MNLENWSRKLAGLAAVVVLGITVCGIVQMFRLQAAGSLQEWASYAKEVAVAFGIVIGLAGLKSIGTDAVAGLKAKGTNPEPTKP